MYIEKRRQGYLAFFPVPKDVQAHFGKRRFAKSLETSDPKTAELRAEAWRRTWETMIAEARGQSTEAIDRDADYWRIAIAAASSESQKALVRDLMLEELGNQAQKVADRMGFDLRDHGDVVDFDKTEEARGLGRFKKIALGELTPLKQYIDPWIGSLTSNATKTVAMKRSTVTEFVTKFPYVQDFVRPNVQKWINELRNEPQEASKDKPRSWTTIKRKQTELRSFWLYLARSNIADSERNPFTGLLHSPSKKESKGKTWKRLEAPDVVRLRNAAFEANDEALANAIWIAMYSGARLGEICALKAEHVHKDHFVVVAGKTDAAVRQVPTHFVLQPILTRLKDASNGSYLITIDAKNRSPAISKRFARLCEKVGGFSNSHVFHSIRKTVSHMLRAASVEDSLRGAVIGHEGVTLVDKVYTRNEEVPLALKAEAIAKLDYGEAKRPKKTKKTV